MEIRQDRMADWGQGNPSHPNFIKGKTHYYASTNLATVSDDFSGTESFSSDIVVEVGQHVRIHNLNIDCVAELLMGSLTYLYATIKDSNDQTVGTLQFQNKKLSGIGGDNILAGASIDYLELKQLDEKFIPDTIARTEQLYEGYEILSPQTGQNELSMRYYYTINDRNGVVFTLPSSSKAQIFKGSLYNSTVEFPSGTFITGDKQYLTISGTTVTGSSSEWYTWTYDSVVKELRFSMYKEL